MGFKFPDLKERQEAAAAAKNAMLAKFRAAAQDPNLAAQAEKRVAINEAREKRIAEREAAKKVREAELAKEAARQAELAAQAEREAEQLKAMLAAEEADRAAALEAEQKAARDERYAARKAALLPGTERVQQRPVAEAAIAWDHAWRRARWRRIYRRSTRFPPPS